MIETNDQMTRVTRAYRRLWASVLLDVIHVIETGNVRNWDSRPPISVSNSIHGCVVSYIDYRDTLRWVNGISDRPTSFIWTCELLGYDPQHVKRYLQTLGKPRNRKTRSAA